MLTRLAPTRRVKPSRRARTRRRSACRVWMRSRRPRSEWQHAVRRHYHRTGRHRFPARRIAPTAGGRRTSRPGVHERQDRGLPGRGARAHGCLRLQLADRGRACARRKRELHAELTTSCKTSETVRGHAQLAGAPLPRFMPRPVVLLDHSTSSGPSAAGTRVSRCAAGSRGLSSCRWRRPSAERVLRRGRPANAPCSAAKATTSSTLVPTGLAGVATRRGAARVGRAQYRHAGHTRARQKPDWSRWRNQRNAKKSPPLASHWG
jgi:hypothetical protein